MLFDSLPRGTVNFAHKVMSYEQSKDSVTVTAQTTDAAGKTQEVKFTGDYLVAADGSNSTIRRLMLPEDKRRLSMNLAGCHLVCPVIATAMQAWNDAHVLNPHAFLHAGMQA